MEGFLQRFAGVSAREGCFEPASSKVDASLVCHEVRSVQLTPDERLCVSFRDISVPGREQFAALGEAAALKALQLGATVQLRVWAMASQDDLVPRKGGGPRRLCGELRIPIQKLVQRWNSCLYHTWVALDSPGLNDSIASTGMLMSADDGEAFEQALSNGPRHLQQPKACLSMLPTSRLPRSGKVIWTEEVANDLRVAQWAPLLRSQQQHIVMCKAQFLALQQQQQQSTTTMAGIVAAALSAPEDLEIKTAEAEQLRARVVELEAAAAAAAVASASTQQQQDEVKELNRQLTQLSNQANRSIDEANNRIRTLKHEKQEASTELEERRNELQRIAEEKGRLAKRAQELEQLLHSKSLDVASKSEQVRSLEGTIRARERESDQQRADVAGEVAEREARIRELEAKELQRAALIEGQQVQLASLQEREQQQRTELVTLRAKLDGVTEEANAKIDAANERAREKQQKLDDAERLGKELATAQLDLTSSLQMQTGQAQEAHREQQLLRDRVRELEALTNTLNAEDGKTKLERDQMQGRVRDMEARELKHTAEVQREQEALRGRVCELEDLNQTFQAQEGKAKSECETLQARVRDLEEKELKYAAEADFLRSSGEEQQRELVELRRELADAAVVAGSGRMGSSSVEQLRDVLRDREDALQRAAHLEQDVRRLTESSRASDQETSGLTERLVTMEQAMQSLREELAAAQHEKEKLRARYDETSRQFEDLVSRVLEGSDNDAMRRSLASAHELQPQEGT